MQYQSFCVLSIDLLHAAKKLLDLLKTTILQKLCYITHPIKNRQEIQ